MTVDREGRGAPVKLASDLKLLGLAVDATSVYWSSNDRSGIWRMDLADPRVAIPVSVADASSGAPAQLVLDETSVYWLSTKGIWSASKTGSQVTMLSTYGVTQTQINSSSLATTNATLYWTTGLTTYRVGTNGTGLMKIDGASGGQLAGIAVDGEHLYWAYGLSGGVWKAMLDGSAPVQLTSSPINPNLLAIDDVAAYYSDSGTLLKVNLDGGSPTSLALTPVPLRATVDATHIYWATSNGFIYKLAK